MAVFEAVPSTTAVATNLAAFKTNAQELVNERYDYALSYATAAFNDALDMFDSLKDMAGDLDDIEVDIELSPEDIPSPAWITLSTPDWSKFDPVDPTTYPSWPLIPPLDWTTFTPPDPLSPPDWSLFTIPKIEDYGIDTKVLDGLLPSNTFNWDPEAIYSSNLLNELKSKCSTDMSSGTGISSSVEADMISRETERDRIINAEARTQVEAEVAEFNWEMPDGILAYGLTQVEDTYQNKRLDKSRDIRVESFNLAQKNIQFAMGVVDSLEGKLEVYQSGMMQRKLEGAKYLVESAILIFKAAVECLMSKIKIFEAIIDVYKTQITTEVEKARAELAVKQADLEGIKVVIGQVQLEIEKVKAETALVGIESDRAKVDIARKQADIESAKFTIEQARIEIERIKAETMLDGITVERSKVDVAIFEGKVKQASTIAQIAIQQAQILIAQYIELNKLRLTAMEEAGKVASQVAAGALSGISAQAHISSSDTFGASGSVQYQGTELITRDESTI